MTDNRQKKGTENKTRPAAYRVLCEIALMAVMIAICSQIFIPWVIPVTMQTFAIFMSLELLGGRYGTYSVVLYLLMGLVGLPVFSGFSGGPGHLLGATGGYLLGFVLIGPVYSITVRLIRSRIAGRLLGLIAGLILCYLFGTVWFVAVYSRSVGAAGFGSALSVCVLPFILPDAAKTVLAMLASDRLRKALARRSVNL